MTPITKEERDLLEYLQRKMPGGAFAVDKSRAGMGRMPRLKISYDGVETEIPIAAMPSKSRRDSVLRCVRWALRRQA
jgi:hypothetical protein